VQSIGEVRTLNLDRGIDFYREVGRFEVALIRLALFQTRGHQRRAARLLNMKTSTLHSKIKHYNICLDDFVTWPIAFPPHLESVQFA
jgi:DNA-binding NtrC family response regulator